MTRRRMIVGVSGATGVVYAVRVLQALRALDVESHLVVTRPGGMTLAYETELSVRDLRDLADVSYAVSEVGAAISSGSFRTMGMVVVPCSMRTVGEIASCATSNLLTRAADVCLPRCTPGTSRRCWRPPRPAARLDVLRLPARPPDRPGPRRARRAAAARLTTGRSP